jgi:acetylornithine/N-succinyldiaminopimelate aminotransferase
LGEAIRYWQNGEWIVFPVVMPTYARADVAFERGEGAYLWDEAGRRYLDFGSGVAVTALGHCHPRLVEALRDQAGRVWHTSNMYRVPGQERVAAKLVEHSFADSVFFCNSGAEAVECCLKIARKYHDEAGRSERYRVICATGAFHGRTLATIAAGGQEKHLKGFAPAMDGFDHVPYGNLNMLRDRITAETAAILVEPVQGEGGIVPGDPEYLRRLRATADEYGLLLIFDEVQTGIGRTGRLFAHQHLDITPDVMASAKGLGGGFPVGACLATEKAARCLTPGSHGSTFGGNPLAMAVAETVLDTVTEAGFLDRVTAIAATLRARLDDLRTRFPALIAEVRGQGLMIGVKCGAIENTALMRRLLAAGLLTVAAGDNVVRLLPPLIIGEDEVALAIDILSAVLTDIAAEARP